MNSPQESTAPTKRLVQQWRLAQETHDAMKSCKISPNGTMLVYWSDYQLLLFTSVSALPEHEETLVPASKFSLGDSTFFWKAIAFTERYLVAATTGGTFNVRFPFMDGYSCCIFPHLRV